MTKFADLKDNQFYRRGRDYPAYAPQSKGNVKMAKVMTGSEVKTWFTEEDLKDYPKPDAYTGSLP